MRAPSEMVHTNKIVSHLAGSLAYGTNLPTSDRDVRGIFFVDRNFYMSPWHNCGEVNIGAEEDTKYYELSKFMTLLVDQNPNIVESLWVRMEDCFDVSPAYLKLRAVREELLSSKCKFTYSGYAFEQMKRIKGHDKWLSNPQPVEPPRQIDYLNVVHNYFTRGESLDMDVLLTTCRKGFCLVPLGNNIFGFYHSTGRELYADDGRFLFNRGDAHWHKNELPLAVIKFNEQEYRLALDNHTNYWNWKNNRNAARSALEEKFGYDTKHAMHLVRLLRTGYEILTEGVVMVHRPDAKDLLEYAQELEAKVESAYKVTDLRRQVNVNKAAELLAELLEECWRV